MLSRLILCTILAVFVLGVASFRPQDSHTARVLVFSKTDGYRHASIEAGQDAFRTFADEHDLDVTFTEDASLFQEDTLKQYHVVVFLNTTQDVLDEEQQRQFERFIKAGGGYVGIHSAADTEYEWPWYGRLVGAYFDGHPNGPNVREGVISVVDSSHMSTQELPDPWVRQDEWYDYRDRNPEVHVLLTVDETTYKTEEENPSEEPHPISWYHEYDGGRVFYTGLGHTSASFTEPLYLAHIWGGLQYALGEGTLPDYSTLDDSLE